MSRHDPHTHRDAMRLLVDFVGKPVVLVTRGRNHIARHAQDELNHAIKRHRRFHANLPEDS